MKNYILELKNVTYQYSDGTKALDSISLGFERGKKYALIGPNGAGKSTLLLHMNGIRKPKQGAVLYEGQELKYDSKGLNNLRTKVGIVFQEPDNQLFSPNVFQEISFGPINLGLTKAEVINRVNSAMESTNILELKDKPTHFLSYGQKKRVAIADILAMKPEVLIMDEPTAGLDPANEKSVEKILNEINCTGTTVIISTHDLNMAYTWADYVYIIDKGRVASYGSPEEVFLDEKVLLSIGMERPWILDIYTYLADMKPLIGDYKIPRSKSEIKDFIKVIIDI